MSSCEPQQVIHAMTSSYLLLIDSGENQRCCQGGAQNKTNNCKFSSPVLRLLWNPMYVGGSIRDNLILASGLATLDHR